MSHYYHYFTCDGKTALYILVKPTHLNVNVICLTRLRDKHSERHISAHVK